MSAFDELHVDHVGLAVGDLARATELFTTGYGLSVQARAANAPLADGVRTVALRRKDIRIVLTEVQHADHPAAAFIQQHGDGVFDIALGTPDAVSAFSEAVRRGARPVAAPAEHDGVVTASVTAFGDVTHTFVQRPSQPDDVRPAESGHDVGLHTIDHFAVCLEPSHLKPTVRFYETVLDFKTVFTEHVVVGAQGMNSTVVQSRSGAVTLTLIEPDLSRRPGQIDQFLKNHGGAGVQHIAFATDDIVRDVGLLSGRGIGFLTTPGTYYELVPGRLRPVQHSVDQLRALNILVDQDQDGQLLQIFTRSTHPRGTLFFEVIERLGARTFGNGNIRALYSAVELQQTRDEAAR